MEKYLVAYLWFIFFSIFHTFTAHEVFKNFLAKAFGEFFVEHFWRLIYCLISYILLYYFFLGPLFLSPEASEPLYDYPQYAFYISSLVKFMGLFITYWACIQLDYFEFWGVKQALLGIKRILMNENWEAIPLAGVQRLEVKGIYYFCRHPMLTGGLLFIAGGSPHKTTMLYLSLYFIYMVLGAFFEERRLKIHFGQQYTDYSREVGAFFPNKKQIGKFLNLLQKSKT